MTTTPQQRGGQDGQILGILAFLLHFSSAIFLAIVAVKCGSLFVSNTYTETVTDSAGYALVFNATCDDPTVKSCFFGMPQSYDTRQDGLKWNVFALLAGFEWISASFALYYLQNLLGREDVTIPLVCLIWNAVGVFLIMPYSMPLSTLQCGATALALLTATLAEANDWFNKDDDTPEGPSHQTGVVDSRGYQFIVPEKTADLANPASKPVKNTYKNVAVLHYTEYCASASLLFVAVLMLYVPDPVSWGPVVGFVGILLCNLAGIGAHYCKTGPAQQGAHAILQYGLDSMRKSLQALHVSLLVWSVACHFGHHLHVLGFPNVRRRAYLGAIHPF